ncbi:membrane metallo-endopeptidase-like 1 [Rhynchophorus ferrugineus]|uniref:membrane metallo-endopeptidase-like 1 n=1 Tax=Rhynchophorus ferrugineus TaxID=354439 RepID=UPI003FCDE1BA
MEKLSEKLQQRSKLERNLMVTVFVLVIACLVLFLLLVSLKLGGVVCWSPKCIEAAHHVLATVDQTADPCQSFHRFACGGFLKTASGDETILNNLERRYRASLKHMIADDASVNISQSRSFKYQREFYKSCLNTIDIENNEDRDYKDIIRYVTESWPMAQGYVADLYWPDVMLKAREKGMLFDFFLKIDVRRDYNRSRVFLEIGLPTRKNFERVLWRDRNISPIMSMVEAWKNGTSSSTHELRATIAFANNLSYIIELTYNQTKDLNIQQQKIKISDLKNIGYLGLQWLPFLTNITNQAHLKDDDIIVFSAGEEYIRRLYYLLLKTPIKIWVNYIVLLNIVNDCEYLSFRYRSACHEIFNRPKPETRDDYCAKEALNKFPGVAEGILIRQSVNKELIDDVNDLIKNVEHELTEALDYNEWMDKNTKNMLRSRLHNLSQVVGWRKDVFDEHTFENNHGYHKLHLMPGTIVEIVQKLRQFQADNLFDKVGGFSGEINEDVLETPKAVANAFYIYSINTLILPAPILYPPIYDVHQPNYLNYGSLGHIIGHELSHIFSGQFWIEATASKFRQKARCLVRDYEKFARTQPRTNTNGNDTLNENIADITGVNLAYTAYQKWVYKHGKEKKLPGLNYTPNQLFWIMSSTYMCSQPGIDDMESANTIHGVRRYRIDASVANSPYFADDFNCPKGTPMNPEKKCRIFA